jgi:hypothetical protein
MNGDPIHDLELKKKLEDTAANARRIVVDIMSQQPDNILEQAKATRDPHIIELAQKTTELMRMFTDIMFDRDKRAEATALQHDV